MLWDIYHSEIPKFLRAAAQTDAMQRLKDIGMNCGCEYTSFPMFAGIAPYSRFDHSLGVALIVWHFTGSMAQAMSGLLHDIATPAFAHVVDFLREDHMKQESTEADTEKWIRESADVMSVLEKYGLPLCAVSDYHRYPVADNDSPKLSADRLEYTLGNAVNYGITTREKAAAWYHDLTVGLNEYGETELVFRSPDTARAFAAASLECSRIYVSDTDRYAMQSLAELLKAAVREEILSEAELYLPEREIIDRLKRSALAGRWEAFCSYSEIVCQDTPGEEENWLQVHAKKRCIDPYIRGEGRVSGMDPDYETQLCAFRESRQDYWLCAR